MADTIPPVAPAAPVAPTLPATVVLPTAPAPAVEAPVAATPPPEGVEGEPRSREDSWTDLMKPPAAEPPAAVAPVPPTPPPVPEKPPTPPAPKTPEVPVAPKPDEKPPVPEKPPGDKPATGDDLPEDLLEGIGDANPVTARDAVKRADKMAKRLRLVNEERKRYRAENADLKAKGGSTPPPDYEETKTRATRLQADLDTRSRELEETRARLYANELTARPEFQDRVVKPWNAVQKTVSDICGRYKQNVDDVWSAFRLPKAEERDAVFAEMLTVMNPLDQRRFTDAIEAIPRISGEQARLEATSKEQLDVFKKQDTDRADRARGEVVTRTANAQKSHAEGKRAAMPFLYQIDGDTPEAKGYNAAMASALTLADQIANGGIDKLSPEMAGMMIHDAVTSDLITRQLGSIVQMHVQRGKEQQAKIEELETANKMLQSRVDEYDGALPGGEGAASGGGGSGAVVPTDAPLGARIAQHAGGFGWGG